MNVDELFKILDESETLTGHRAELRAFLNATLTQYHHNPAKGESLAYDIAGLMGAQAIIKLPDGDLYAEIIALAGDLELPEKQRDKSSTWEKFEVLLSALPND